MKSYQRVLIANRGEIAVRVLKTCRKLGLTGIVMYSEADRETLAVEMAEESYLLGPAALTESYLNVERILALAKRVAAQAIHPGYGMLSENSEFARRVREAGLIWIGPTSECMDLVANKTRARELAAQEKIPVLPGFRGGKSVDEFVQVATRIGFPVMLKAALGGGGRGIRKVNSGEEIRAQLELAQREAKTTFGNEEIFVEKCVEQARHVEVQIFGDTQGQVVHLGERDCSSQRRQQKILEESPSPGVSASLREKLTAAAIQLARASKYVGAGTVEFLVRSDSEFYFMEMNARLQVEHPVTELVTGLDLVEWQLRVADGEPLPLKQSQISFRGWALQARVYSEDAFDHFRPQTGRIEAFHFPETARVDHFLSARTTVSPYYDAMLAKVLVHAEDRSGAMERMVAALDETLIVGPVTNLSYLRQILESSKFADGQMVTTDLDKPTLPTPISAETREFVAQLAALCLWSRRCHEPLGAWSNAMERRTVFVLSIDGQRFHVEVGPVGESIRVTSGHRSSIFNKVSFAGNRFAFTTNEASAGMAVIVAADFVKLNWDGQSFHIKNELFERKRSEAATDPNRVLAPMDGVITRIAVKLGDEVNVGQLLAVVEAMKMQLELKSARQGRVGEILVAEKAQVRRQQMLIQLTGEG